MGKFTNKQLIALNDEFEELGNQERWAEAIGVMDTIIDDRFGATNTRELFEQVIRSGVERSGENPVKLMLFVLEFLTDAKVNYDLETDNVVADLGVLLLREELVQEYMPGESLFTKKLSDELRSMLEGE